jgi:hypothetical protein
MYPLTGLPVFPFSGKNMNILQDIETAARQISVRTERLYVSMGGINSAIISRDTEFLNQLQERFRPAESTGKVDYEIILIPALHQEFVEDFSNQPLHASVKRVKSGDNYIIKQTDHPFMAIVNTTSRKVLVKMPRDLSSFSGFLRALYSLILVWEKAILLNATAVSEKGRSKVLFGPYSFGKTMVDWPNPHHSPVVDDTVIIKNHNGRYRVYGTPFQEGFPGESMDSVRSELNGLYLLKKDTENRIVVMNNKQAVSALFRNVIFYSDDAKLLSQVLRTCRNIASSVPVYELHFRSDVSFWELIRT